MGNDATGKKWSDFTDAKSGMVEWNCEFLQKMESKGIPVSIIQLDPAGKLSSWKSDHQVLIGRLCNL